jgi:hypothetical protein
VSDHPPTGASVEIPSGEGEPLVFVRPADEPFTPAEIARARRLSELAQRTRETANSGGLAGPAT